MKKSKPLPDYVVYQIRVGTFIYYGYTQNIEIRGKQHNRAIKSGLKKEFYDALRVENIEAELILEPVMNFNSKTEAKRYEAYLILDRHFRGEKLWQSIPKIRDL